MAETSSTFSAAIVVLWEFVRGDLTAADFASWCYDSPELEAVLGHDEYIALVSVDFRDVVAVDSVRERLNAALRAMPGHTCDCLAVANCGVVDMGEHEGVFASLEEVGNRGEPYWWLWAARCRECGQGWLVASEERQNDVFCMKRISSDVLSDIVAKAHWPSDFDRYETLLQIGRAAGRSVRFLDPLTSSSLADSVRELASARPGMPLSEIATLLNIDRDLAREIALRVMAQDSVSIAMDQ